MRQFRKLFFIPFLLVCLATYAQTRTVSGKVVSAQNNQPISGASVLLKGTSTGTLTDNEGSFSLNVPVGKVTLVISYVGYTNLEQSLGAGESNVTVRINENNTELGAVVVTALGIRREKRALGYSSQNVSGEELTNAREVNILNSLSGKIAGVQINKTGTGPAGSARITIRGNNFLSGDNQPLIVIDGIPMDNYQTADGQSEYGSFDGGNGLADLNPDDIADLNVLKGPAASALYGIRGGNGVIVVTTKKGIKRQGLGVRFSTDATFETPLLYPDVQNEYAQGSAGVFDVKSQGSWGPKITGQDVTDWTGQSRPLSADPNDLKNFLQKGLTTNNAIALSGGGDKTTFRVGYSHMDNKGLLPTSTLKRDFASVKVNSQLTNAFSVDARINYTNQRTNNRPQTSGSPSNIFAQYQTMPRSVHLTDMDPWEDNEGAMILWLPSAYSTLRNPYWTLYKDFNRDQSDRFLTMISLEYKFASWLKLQVRHGMDIRQAFTEGANAYGIRDLGSGALNFNSGYSASKSRAIESNADFLLTANKKISDFSINLSAGGNRVDQNYNSVGGSTGLLDLPGVYSLGVGSLPRPTSYTQKSRINSLYGFLNLGFRNYLFADVTYRNDWVSVLAKDNRSFHYPSYSLTAILNDLFSDLKAPFPDFISFAKLRAAYAEAGSVTIDPYSLTPTFGISRGYGDLNILVTSPPRTLFDPNIKPGLVKSQEYGVELKFWKNRIGIDFTYYKKDGVNQILPLPLPGATGFSTAIINAGKISNKGYEFTVTGSPLKSTFTWDIAVNYNHNKNEVISLDPRQKTYFLQGDVNSRAIRIMANEGEPYGNIFGRDFARDDNGNIIVETDGTPRKSEDKNTLIGNFQPKYTMGIENKFSYKNFNLSFLIDMRQGGQFYSQSLAFMYGAGTAQGTLAYREGGMIVNGVLEDGSKNGTPITSQQYWDKVAGAEPVASLFIYDASNVRLREVVFGYNIPNKVWGKFPVRNVFIGLVGRNLWLISSNIPGIDPESSFNTTNAQGWENGSYPSTKSYGASLRVEF